MSVDIDIDVDTAICFLGARLSSHSDALLCAWRVHTRTRALEHPLLDPRSRSVRISLIFDLETTTALSLHELFDLLCGTLKRFPRSAISTLSFGASRPQMLPTQPQELQPQSPDSGSALQRLQSTTVRANGPVQSLVLTCWAARLVDSILGALRAAVPEQPPSVNTKLIAAAKGQRSCQPKLKPSAQLRTAR